MPSPTPLLPLVEKYIDKTPASAARHLESMTEEEAVEVLQALPPALAARTFPYLQVSYLALLFKSLGVEVFRKVIRSLDPQKAATVFMHLPEDDQKRLFPEIPKKVQLQVQELLTYPTDSVSQIMITKFLSFRKEIKVRDAIKKIRAMAQKKLPMSYGYVTDDGDRLVGVINMHDLVLASPETPLEAILKKEVFTLSWSMGIDEAAKELAKRRYFAAPVVDNENRIMGIIKAEQLIHGVQVEVTGDIQRMVGVSEDERVFSPILFSLRKRLPWLHVNLLTAFLAASVVALFEDIIAKLTILAVFLPVVAGQGGNAGAQSLAIVMRGLFMREVPGNKVWLLILKEGWMGIINGLITGSVTALVAWVWYGNPYLGLVVGLGMLVNLFFAGLAGASIPIIMKAVGLDPAQCSSIILTTVTDVIGFFAFLGFALLFQSYLL